MSDKRIKYKQSRETEYKGATQSDGKTEKDDDNKPQKYKGERTKQRRYPSEE